MLVSLVKEERRRRALGRVEAGELCPEVKLRRRSFFDSISGRVSCGDAGADDKAVMRPGVSEGSSRETGVGLGVGEE